MYSEFENVCRKNNSGIIWSSVSEFSAVSKEKKTRLRFETLTSGIRVSTNLLCAWWLNWNRASHPWKKINVSFSCYSFSRNICLPHASVSAVLLNVGVLLTDFLRLQSENSTLPWSVTFVSLHWLNIRIQTIFTLLQQNHNQLKFKIMIKYKMDYTGIYITVINVLFYIYNYICVHSSVNKSWQCACKAQCRKQWY